MKSGASTRVIVASSFTRTWSDGPAVSLNGSPTVSPTTVAAYLAFFATLGFLFLFITLVSGAAIRFDGQLSVFDSRDAQSPCYNCLFPEAEDVEEGESVAVVAAEDRDGGGGRRDDLLHSGEPRDRLTRIDR